MVVVTPNLDGIVLPLSQRIGIGEYHRVLWDSLQLNGLWETLEWDEPFRAYSLSVYVSLAEGMKKI
jgi:hypothetical protein